jgi:phenylalanine-4-hydroxylase
MNRAPLAPTQAPVKLRGNYAQAAADFRVAQNYDAYTADEQAIWRTLFQRQMGLLNDHAAPEFMAGLRLLGVDAHSIPVLEEASERLRRLTGFEVIGVPGLIPEADFFAHLAERRFPVTVWMRRRDELDYLVEPDLFHDFFGHLPMLAHTVFANFIQAYGAIGAHAKDPAALKMLARLYWYTVEFGLIRTTEGLRIFGAGIMSSTTESVFALEDPSPNRIAFDLERVMRTKYIIDDFQQTYFVIDSFQSLLDECYRDFGPIYAWIGAASDIAPDELIESDRIVSRGTLAYLNDKTHKP